MLVALGAIDPGSNPGGPTTSLRQASLYSSEKPPRVYMGIGDRWIRFVSGLMGKNPEETQEEKAERIAAEADKRIAEAKGKDSG